MKCKWYFRIYNFLGFSEVKCAVAQTETEAKQIILKESEYPIEKMEYIQNNLLDWKDNIGDRPWWALGRYQYEN